MAPTATLPSADQAFSALNSFQAPSAADVLSGAEAKYGVGDLATRVQNLQTLSGNLTNSIAAVDPSVTARTAGSLVDEGQRSALVDRERAPLTTELSSNDADLNTATGNLNTATGNAKDLASAEDTDNQNKYNQLLQSYNIANAREEAQATATAQAAAATEASKEHEEDLNEKYYADNTSAASSAASSAVNPAQGYSVKQLTSGNKAYSGPNGQTTLEQYAAALAGGDPNGTYQNILTELKTGSPTDKTAYNKVAKLSASQGLAYLHKNNSYIFN